MGVWAGFFIYLSSSIKAEQHVATLLVSCRMSHRQQIFPPGQGGDAEKDSLIKSGVQIQMAEIHLVPRIKNREVREVSKCRRELSQLV